MEGILADWSIPGEHRAAAAFDVARTVCRRAERSLVRLQEAGTVVQPAILAYLNRLSDLLWLFGRKLEHAAGVSASLRETTGKAATDSRARGKARGRLAARPLVEPGGICRPSAIAREDCLDIAEYHRDAVRARSRRACRGVSTYCPLFPRRS
jgi:cob(I)alamin adenosyltransferase